MEEKKNIPEIRFEGFVGEWEESFLDRVADVRDGTHASPKYLLQGHPFITSKNLKNGDINYEDINYISDIDFNEINKRSKVDINDILMGMIGTIGNIALIKKSPDFAIKNVALIKDTGKVYYLYLYYYFHITFLTKQLTNGMDGGTQKFIALNKIRKLSVLLPSKTEQSQIGTFFQNLDKQITLEQQKHEKLISLKKAMLEKMFPKEGATVPEIRFEGFEGEWENLKLNAISDIVGGGTPSTIVSEYWNGDIDWYSPTEIGGNVYVDRSVKKITQLGLANSSANILPKNKTILFTSRAGIGDMAILNKDGATNQGFQSFVLKNGIEPYFIYSAGHLIKKFALKHASGSTFLEVSGKILGEMKLLIPSEPEQSQIGTFFQNLDKLISLQQQKIDKVKNIKKACLDKMFV